MLEKARAEISGVIPGVQDISVAACWELASYRDTVFVGLEESPLGDAVALKEYSWSSLSYKCA